MRRTVAAACALGAVVVIAFAIVVLRPGSSARRSNVAAATNDAGARTTTVAGSTTTLASWNVPVSRSDAIASGHRATSGGDASNTVTAKLMTYGDWQRLGRPSVQTPGTPDSLRVWVVEVIGNFPVAMGPLPSYQWGIWLFNAHTGDVVGGTAGPGASPLYWDRLPDHSSSKVTFVGRALAEPTASGGDHARSTPPRGGREGGGLRSRRERRVPRLRAGRERRVQLRHSHRVGPTSRRPLPRLGDLRHARADLREKSLRGRSNRGRVAGRPAGNGRL